jgi:hypothetical protein
MRVTEQEYAEILKRSGVRGQGSGEGRKSQISGAQAAKKRFKGKAKHKPRPAHTPGKMNKTEQEFAHKLSAMDDVLYWQFEALTFKLGHRCTYTPDFIAVTQDEIRVYEVKGGFIREDAMVKFKSAADKFPQFRWIMAQKKRGEWKVEVYD